MAHMVKSLPGLQETRFSPWVGKIPWQSKWQPTPVFLPGEFRGQRNLVGYSPWGHKELDMTDIYKKKKGRAAGFQGGELRGQAPLISLSKAFLHIIQSFPISTCSIYYLNNV